MFVWLAKRNLPDEEGDSIHYIAIDLSKWIFVQLDDTDRIEFSDMTYLKQLRDNDEAKDPSTQLRGLLDMAEQQTEQGNMNEQAYKEIADWTSKSLSTFKRKREE